MQSDCQLFCHFSDLLLVLLLLRSLCRSMRSADQRYVMTETESNGCPAGHTGVDKQDQPNMLTAQPLSPT